MSLEKRFSCDTIFTVIIGEKRGRLMEQQNAVRLTDLIKTLSFETLYLPENVEDILVYSNDVNRPGLQLAGFFDYFDRNRMQIMGKVEFSYLEGMTSEQRREAIDRLFEFKFPALICNS